MSIPCRLALIAGLLVTATACRQAAPTTALSPLAAPVRADVHHVASGVDSIQLSLRALLRNPLADTLTLEATCGGPALYLEYADGERWRPVLQGVVTRQCGGYTELRVAPGDSAIVADVIAGTRAERYLGLRWLAPLTARYRLTTRASRCIRRTRRDCWVTLASAPFDVTTAPPRADRP